MESNLTKAEFRVNSKLQGVPGELVRLANETLARELTISLSAFLRTSVIAAHTSGGEISFGEFPWPTAGPASGWRWCVRTTAS